MKNMKGMAVTQQITDMTREQLLEALERMRQRRAQWETLELQCMNAEEALLKKTGELENTIVIVTSDNGLTTLSQLKV